LQASENQEIALNKSSLKLFEDLKERINQLSLDEDAKGRLNERISELRESNAALTASGSARELEVQAMAKRIDEMAVELSNCRDELTTKSDELATLHALPKEDPILVSKIRDLEKAKTLLEGQINSVNQEASKAKEEVVSCRETILNAQEQSQELQGKLIEAQTMIKTLIEDKKKYIANHKAEVEQQCNKVARDAHAAKTETKLQHDCRVKNLEQRRSEAEKELALVQGELQKSQEETVSYTSNLNKLQEELSACKDQMAQQSAYIKRADQQLPARDVFDRRQGELQQAIARLTELKAHFEVVQKETSQQIGDAVMNHQIEVADLMKRVNALEREISKPVQAPHKMGHPAVAMSKSLAAPRPSSAASDLSSSQSGTNDDSSFSLGMPATSKDLLRQKELRSSSTVQRGNSFAGAKPSETHKTSSDVTPCSGQRPQVESKVVRTNSTVAKLANGSSSPYHGTPKQLRVANRKSSGLSQLLPAEESMTTIEVHRVTVSSLGQTDRSPVVQLPKDTAMLSFGQSRMSSGRISSTVTQPLRVEKPGSSSYANNAGHEERSIVTKTPTDKTPYNGSPQLPSSSPLTDLDPSSVDLLGHDEEDWNKTASEAKATKFDVASFKKDDGRRTSRSTHLAAVDTVTAVKFEELPTSFGFADDDEYAGVNASRSKISASDESTRRRQFVPLKSALKKSSQAQEISSTYEIPASTPTDRGVSRPARIGTRQTPPARQGTGSSYNRIASGSKSDGILQPSAAPSAVRKPSAAQQIDSNADKSPMMSAPARNSRKRSASLSEAKSQTTKPAKQPRISLPNQRRRETRTVIPDSQEEYSRR
jgi:hypothetical protein